MASGDATVGPIEILGKISPPFNGKGPFKTKKRADDCCNPVITEADLVSFLVTGGGAGPLDPSCPPICPFTTRRYYYLQWRNITGINNGTGSGPVPPSGMIQTDKQDLLLSLTNSAYDPTSPSCNRAGISLGHYVGLDPVTSILATLFRDTSVNKMVLGFLITPVATIGRWTSITVANDWVWIGTNPMCNVSTSVIRKSLCTSVTGLTSSLVSDQKIADISFDNHCGGATPPSTVTGTAELWIAFSHGV